MNNKKFEEILTFRLNQIKCILGNKAKEYASDTDRLHNFKVAGRIQNTTPEKALKGMMVKHEVSVQDLIEWAETSPEKLNEIIIDEKIGDCINYLILLEALLKEQLCHQEHIKNINRRR